MTSVYAETPLQFERGFSTMGTEAVMQQMLSNGAVINEVGHVMATSPAAQSYDLKHRIKEMQ